MEELGAARTDATLETMAVRRCGLLNAEGCVAQRGCSWPVGQTTLVYDFGHLPEDLPEHDVIDAIEQAILIWNDVLSRTRIPLELVRKQEGQEVVHVLFSWERHDAEMPASLIPVAHADFPPACGVLSKTLPRPVHFEEAQEWTVGVVPGRLNITAVAVHEIGHILGLVHSSDPGSVMFSSLELNEQPSEADERELARLYRAATLSRSARSSAPGAKVPPAPGLGRLLLR
jgi:hypothetical protein